MGALSLVGTGLTPKNSTKAGNFIRMRVRDSAGPTSPANSPFQGGASGVSLVITNAQLQVMAPRGNLRRLFRAVDEAVPNSGLTAAALTQAQARALLNSQDSCPTTPTVLLSNRTPRSILTIAGQNYIGGGQIKPNNRAWSCDASVDASGRPTVIVRCTYLSVSSVAIASPFNSPADAFLDIRFDSQLTGR
ncbi:MAG: hypothetical protein WC700_17775 [Gemmatimonadaceae bacterium]|jgi:hypothetical protein